MKTIIVLTILLVAVVMGTLGCSQEYDPVCGEDGSTYSNTCFMKLAGVKLGHDGECA